MYKAILSYSFCALLASGMSNGGNRQAVGQHLGALFADGFASSGGSGCGDGGRQAGGVAGGALQATHTTWATHSSP